MGTQIRSVSRALAALEALSRAPAGGLGVTELARMLDVDLATASRLLATLEASRFATRTRQRKFVLGPGALETTRRWFDPLTEHATPELCRVAVELGETVHLLRLVGDRAVTLASFSASRVSYPDERAPSYPLWASAAGRAMLALLPAQERVRLLPVEPYPAFTPRTVTRWAELKPRINDALQHGFASESGELIDGLACFARALMSREGETFAVAVSCERRRVEAIGTMLTAGLDACIAALGHEPRGTRSTQSS